VATRYNVFDTEIAVLASPLMPAVNDAIFYKVIGDFKENKDYVASLSLIEDLEKQITAFDKKAVKFFVELIYPYKKYVDYKTKKGWIKMDIDQYNTIKNDALIFVGNKYLNEGHYYLCSGECDIFKFDQSSVELEIPNDELHYKLITDHIKSLYNLLGFLEHYDIEKIKQHAVLWKVYNSFKV
jgi:hypothetical protein